MRTYTELITIPTYEGRVEYLQTHSSVGEDTFGWLRYLNQKLYTSAEWRRFRRDVILRDAGCDLALPGYDLDSKNIIIHHINPIDSEMVLNRDPMIFAMDNVVCVSHQTHRFIHYGNLKTTIMLTLTRSPNDTCPWKNTERRG